MRHISVLVVLGLCSQLFACHAADGVKPEPPAGAVPDAKPSPLEPLARMMGGEWKMTVDSGTTSFRTWHWGPGRHSLREMTDGEDAAGNPWRDLDVYYWHPGSKQISVFGVSQFARGITDGRITFEGETAQTDFDLHQTGGLRTLRLLWEFDGPDKYHATLLEKELPGRPKYTFMAAWDLFRTDPPIPPRPLAVENATEPSPLVKPLKPLLGTWNAVVDVSASGALSTRSTIEWIPLADAIYARVVTPGADEQPLHVLDAYLYHHTGTGTLRCLALSSRGDVYEGDVSVLEDGNLELNLVAYADEQAVRRVVRVDLENDQTLRLRAWSVDGVERTLRMDARHTKAAPTEE